MAKQRDIDAAAIVWFRQDLRLADNPALDAAIRTGLPVLPVYIWCPEEEYPWAPGGASRYWLHQSLESLGQSLEKRGSRLIIRKGPAATALSEIAHESRGTVVFWNRRYEPQVLARDRSVEHRLTELGIDCRTFNASLLFEPWEVQTKEGRPYQVFTPYWRTCLGTAEPADPLAAPNSLRTPSTWPRSLALGNLKLEPRIPWAKGIASAWRFGEVAAMDRLETFLDENIGDYSLRRDTPSQPGTSRLSPHLHFGEISPRQIWHATHDRMAAERDRDTSDAAQKFLAEIGWREFSYHLLYHFPTLPREPLRDAFRAFPWQADEHALKAWQRGLTGYPIVDAGMRELWTTGWMHNRVRMIVASFLTKDLLISWHDGAVWFWDTLVDADLASNTQGWQWTAGCGADAAPYFRVFNPVSQGEKFDPRGEYVRRWVPELCSLPDGLIHKPWEASPIELASAGVALGNTYPAPVVDHAEARKLALAAYETISRRR
ncbi:MAG: deoxyribodipyrimidine photolyase [Candidatus Hydrogenedentota bacterium]